MKFLRGNIKKIANILLAMTLSISLLIFLGVIYDDVSTQCTANKIILQKIDQHVASRSLERIKPLKEHCSASTFCLINNYCPTSYTISYKDGSFECAYTEIEYFRGIFARAGKCNNF